MTHLGLAGVIASLAACVVNGTPVGTAPAVLGGGGCFAGEWNGGGDDANFRHLGFRVVLAQDGAALSGTFELTFEMGRTGTVRVTGTADCAAGTATLRGLEATGVAAVASYQLTLLPEQEGHVQSAFEGTWTCGDDCTAGTIKGYRDHGPPRTSGR